MKLIGSYTSPYVRKISVMLLEKGIPFDFINDVPHEPGCKITQFNPLGKVPALVTDDGEVFYDSPIIVQFIELMNVAPTLLPWQPLEALRVKQIEALADGVTDAAVALVLEGRRDPDKRNEAWVLRQRKSCCAGWTRWKNSPGNVRYSILKASTWPISPSPARWVTSTFAVSRQAGVSSDRS